MHIEKDFLLESEANSQVVAILLMLIGLVFATAQSQAGCVGRAAVKFSAVYD